MCDKSRIYKWKWAPLSSMILKWRRPFAVILQFERYSSWSSEGVLEVAIACMIAERPSLWIRFLFFTVRLLPRFRLARD